MNNKNNVENFENFEKLIISVERKFPLSNIYYIIFYCIMLPLVFVLGAFNPSSILLALLNIIFSSCLLIFQIYLLRGGKFNNRYQKGYKYFKYRKLMQQDIKMDLYVICHLLSIKQMVEQLKEFDIPFELGLDRYQLHSIKLTFTYDCNHYQINSKNLQESLVLSTSVQSDYCDKTIDDILLQTQSDAKSEKIRKKLEEIKKN